MVPEKSKNNASVKSWRQRLDILRGTATRENEGESLSADVHLVAFGVKKNVTGLQFSQWLAGKGLQVLSCDLLTKYEGARYKITIKSCDCEKALNPELWPSRVGLRQYKFFDSNKQKKNEGTLNRRSKQEKSRSGPSKNTMQINQPGVLEPILHANLNRIPRRDYFSPSSQNLMQLQTNFQTLKPSNGFQNMSQTPDVNNNSYQAHNVNDNLLRSQFNHQTPVMDPLKGLQSSFQGKK